MRCQPCVWELCRGWMYTYTSFEDPLLQWLLLSYMVQAWTRHVIFRYAKYGCPQRPCFLCALSHVWTFIYCHTLIKHQPTVGTIIIITVWCYARYKHLLPTAIERVPLTMTKEVLAHQCYKLISCGVLAHQYLSTCICNFHFLSLSLPYYG